jgi:hypothetical protein
VRTGNGSCPPPPEAHLKVSTREYFLPDTHLPRHIRLGVCIDALICTRNETSTGDPHLQLSSILWAWCPQVLFASAADPSLSSFQREHHFLYTRHFSLTLGATIFFGSGTSTTCTSRTLANGMAPSPTSISSRACLIPPFPLPDIIAFFLLVFYPQPSKTKL